MMFLSTAIIVRSVCKRISYFTEEMVTRSKELNLDAKLDDICLTFALYDVGRLTFGSCAQLIIRRTGFPPAVLPI